MEKGKTNSIAKNIKKYRLLNHMTQDELAQKLYLDTQYYAQLERGERNFTIEKIILACSTFHIGVEDIIEIPKDNVSINDTRSILNELISQLSVLSHSQLLLVQKFITEVIPYCK